MKRKQNLKSCLRRRLCAFAVKFFTLTSLQAFFTTNASSNSLKPTASSLLPGDILLVPLNCYVCNTIEKETGVPYSHSVIVANSGAGSSEIFVYEAWGKVTRTPLSEIQKRAQKNESLFHLRPREFSQGKAPTEIELSEIFEKNFSNAQFDDQFLWNNYDENNREKLYCSEFVAKFINLFLTNPLPAEPMSFRKQQSFWEKYFKQFDQIVPQDEPGISPATLYTNSRFIKLGKIRQPDIAN